MSDKYPVVQVLKYLLSNPGSRVKDMKDEFPVKKQLNSTLYGMESLGMVVKSETTPREWRVVPEFHEDILKLLKIN